MIPSHFVIFWDNEPVGLDNPSGGYPYKTNEPSQVKYWRTKEEAQSYCNSFSRSTSSDYSHMIIHEIQFRIVS